LEIKVESIVVVLGDNFQIDAGNLQSIFAGSIRGTST
jgi:hypothetical protein